MLKGLIENYQCPGCSLGSSTECGSFEKGKEDEGCKSHHCGTFITGIGKVFLGLPKGFNRLGVSLGDISTTKVYIFRSFAESWGYDIWNVPVWKHLTQSGHTIVRAMCPRINRTDIHIFEENCIDKIDCIEITSEMIEEME